MNFIRYQKSQSHLQLLGCSDEESSKGSSFGSESRNPTFSCWAVRTWVVGCFTILATRTSRNPTFSCWAVRTPNRRPRCTAWWSRRNPTFSCWAVRTWSSMPSMRLPTNRSRNPTFSCWAVRTCGPSRRRPTPASPESQSHLQLLGCSDRVVRAAGRLALSPSTSQSHLQLLGCSDVQQLTMQLGQDFKSQSHLQLLGCSDGQSFHRHRDARQRVAIPPSVAGLFGPTWSASLPTQAAPTACRNPTFSCWAVRTRTHVWHPMAWGGHVAIPPSVAGLFGQWFSVVAIVVPPMVASQSHLQLLGCSD